MFGGKFPQNVFLAYANKIILHDFPGGKFPQNVFLAYANKIILHDFPGGEIICNLRYI
jgi:hypothetical protein